MNYQLNTKMVTSLIATTLIVSGLAYAATTITSTTQTVVNNDIMSAAWFNDVNSKLASVTTKLANVSLAQNRITGSCPAGKAIQSIAADGTVVCVSSGAPKYSGTFYGNWMRWQWWEYLDNTVTIACHKWGSTIVNNSEQTSYTDTEGNTSYGYAINARVAPDCSGGQFMGQPPVRVILTVASRENWDWPNYGTTYTFGSGPGELPFNQEHTVWDYVSNGRNILRLTVENTNSVTNLRVRSEDGSSMNGGVSFNTEVQYVGD